MNNKEASVGDTMFGVFEFRQRSEEEAMEEM